MLKFTKSLAFSLLMLIALSSCYHQQKFTTVKWLAGDGLDFPERDDIVDDLLQSYKMQGMTHKQVHHLLGYPQWSDSTSFYYQVVSTHTNKLKPDHIKNLVFYMGKDSVITKVVLYDNKAKKK